MPNSNERESFVKRLTEIINANITNEQFGVNELAREVGMSRSNLHRWVKGFTGKSVSTYICDVRLDKATQLLNETSNPISEIAFECGFHSPTYFSKCYRDRYGYPPGEARNHNHNKESQENIQGQKENKGIATKRISILYFFATLLILIVAIVLILWKPFKGVNDPEDKSIAVLPFINDSPEVSEMYFIDGTMEAILNNLCKIEGLSVASRTSVEQYRHNSKPAKAIGEELNVRYIVEGSGQKQGDRIQLTIQLIDAVHDVHIWSEKYNRSVDQLFELQSEIAQLVAGEIKVIISPEEKARIENVPTESQAAYELYLRASSLTQFRSDNKTLEKALDLFHYALDYDSLFAMPYAQIGFIYNVLYVRNPVENEDFLDSVLYYANKALSHDDQLEFGFYMRGIYYNRLEQYDRAIIEFDKVIRINPNYWYAYNGKGWACFIENEFIQSIENFHRVVQLNRGANLAQYIKNLGFAFNQAGFPEKYKELLIEALAIDGDSLDFYRRCSYAERAAGNFDEALEAAQKAYLLDTIKLESLENLMLNHYLLGHQNEALRYCYRYLDRMEALNQFIPYEISSVVDILRQAGNDELAGYYLEKLKNFYQDEPVGGSSFGRIRANIDINALDGDYDKMIGNLEELAHLKNLNIWASSIRTGPLFREINTRPEFLRITGEIESKYELQLDQNRQWLEENDML